MSDQWIDLGLNESLKVEDGGADGPYIVLYPIAPGPQYGHVYRVTLSEQANGKWRAAVPVMPQIVAEADTRDAAKKKLAQKVKQDLRQHIEFIREAEPLITQYIQSESAPRPEEAVIRGRNVPVWQLIASMPEAFVASARGDDTLLIDAERVESTADSYDLPDDAVRAAIAYYLKHKWQLRNRIVHSNLERVDKAFARLREESGLSDEELAALAVSADDD